MTVDSHDLSSLKRFFDKYVRLVPSKLDSYSYGHWKLTQRLERLGSEILREEVTSEPSFLLFLIEVAVWKEPFEQPAKKMIENILPNTYSEIASSKSKLTKALESHQDAEAIDAIGLLNGFGGAGGSRKVASAVLRFLDPSRYATVDYRNWAVLSNTETESFTEPFLEPMASTIEASRRQPIGTPSYMKYLLAVRKLAEETGKSPAEVDMALFAYSDEIIPLSPTRIHTPVVPSAPHTRVKYQRMEALVVEVISDVKNKGHLKPALTLERYLNNVRRTNPTPAGIMQLCRALTAKRSYMDDALESRGIRTLRSILPDLQKIYNEPEVGTSAI